jgi:hypothetical protein
MSWYYQANSPGPAHLSRVYSLQPRERRPKADQRLAGGDVIKRKTGVRRALSKEGGVPRPRGIKRARSEVIIKDDNSLALQGLSHEMDLAFEDMHGQF